MRLPSFNTHDISAEGFTVNIQRFLLLAGSLCISQTCAAVTVAQWDFNKSSTKQTVSMNGASFATLGGVTTAFVAQLGSSDPSSGGVALNTSNYAAQGKGDQSSGVQFMIDTSGYEKLVFSFDQRNSSTASAYTALLYTVNGTDWLNATTFQMTSNSSFVNGKSWDFSGITDAANNANFGVRLLSTFAPGTSNYVCSACTSGSYAPGGTIRYDMVTLSGSEVADVPPLPVPEASSSAMLAAGLAMVGFMARRRRDKEA